MITQGNPSAYNPFSTHLTTQFMLRHHNEQMSVEKLMSPEDIAFVNHGGVNPSLHADRFIPALYIRAGCAEAPQPEYYPASQQPIQNLSFAQQTQLARCQEQMTRLLENAKGACVDRGLAEEPQVAEAIDTIDAVLRNIKSFAQPEMSEQSAKFNEIYGPPFKHACESVVVGGRNPYPAVTGYVEVGKVKHAAPQSHEEAWQKAMDTVRPQTRAMAEQLKDMLAPFAQLQPEGRGSEQAAEQGQAPVARWGSRELLA